MVILVGLALPHYWRIGIMLPIAALGNFVTHGGVAIGASLYTGIVYSDILAHRAPAVFALIGVLGIMVW
jgi:hypothetical protein